VNEELHNHLAGLDHTNHYGGGMLSPDGKSFYVNIPKNATSFITQWLSENNWKFPPGGNAVEEVVVVLRDPIERFVSGFCQYIQGSILYPTFGNIGQPFSIKELTNYWPMVERFMANQVVWFDDHTWFQHYYIKDVLPNIPRRYFWLDKTQLTIDLKQAYNLNDPSPQVLADTNVSKGEAIEIQQLIRGSLDNPVILERVKEILAPDYAIISKALTK